ncbi:MAG: cadmium-translocating P-type ATPase [Rikenellaceae bacterium]|nr:cadmium-translocating P-type ATPase [Rikenellaceae bacterium]MDE7356325.1 cadmium-translocating P-type ATPase [Rikenellaceae bacterium]
MVTVVSMVVSAAMLAFGMTPYADMLFSSFAHARAVWFAAAFLPVGLPVIVQMTRQMARGVWFSEFMLMTVASAGAFYIGEYPEGVAVMLFYSLGEYLQHRAVHKAHADIEALLGLRSLMVTVITPTGAVETPPQEVAVGSTIEVKAGQSVAIDSRLSCAEALFDTSAMTGESIPRLFREGDRVSSGLIAKERAVRLVTVESYDRSAVSDMVRMVEEAGRRKARTELFIRRFARIYTPAVILGAVLIVAVPYLVWRLGGMSSFAVSEWIYRAVVFLAVSCPCALVMSVPLSYFSGIGIASRYGILFKGGDSIESAARVDTVLFDKTGTLTDGVFDVQSVVCVSDVSEHLMVGLTAALEAASTHPVACAVVRYAQKEKIAPIDVDQITEIAGHGMAGSYRGKRLLAGNLSLLRDENITLPDHVSQAEGTMVACAYDGTFLGYISLGDRLKDDSRDAVRQLRSLGITDIAILSGDHQQAVDAVAGKLSIEGHGDMLPGDKAAFVESVTRRGHKSAFVGDGINDAPVMATADVAVAMGRQGSDVAVLSADVVIESDEPSKVAVAVKIGRATVAVVRQNVIMAVAVKMAVLLTGALGILSIWGAVFADVGILIVLVANALRILKMKFGTR